MKFNKEYNYLVILGKKRFKEIACIIEKEKRIFTNKYGNRKAIVKTQVKQTKR